VPEVHKVAMICMREEIGNENQWTGMWRKLQWSSRYNNRNIMHPCQCKWKL